MLVIPITYLFSWLFPKGIHALAVIWYSFDTIKTVSNSIKFDTVLILSNCIKIVSKWDPLYCIKNDQVQFDTLENCIKLYQIVSKYLFVYTWKLYQIVSKLVWYSSFDSYCRFQFLYYLKHYQIVSKIYCYLLIYSNFG